MRFLKKFLEMLGGVGGIPLKYGPTSGLHQCVVPVKMAASTIFQNNSGKFVTMDASGYAALTTVGAASIFGWVMGEAQTTSATAGGTTLPCMVARDAVYRIPVNNAYTAGGTAILWRAIIGKKLDLQVTNSIQGLNADSATAGGHVVVVAQDPWVSAPSASGYAAITTATGCRWVDVQINAALPK